jgi:hypothetical protein
METLRLTKADIRAKGGLTKMLTDADVTHIVLNEKVFVVVGERDILLNRTQMRETVLIKTVDAPNNIPAPIFASTYTPPQSFPQLGAPPPPSPALPPIAPTPTSSSIFDSPAARPATPSQYQPPSPVPSAPPTGPLTPSQQLPGGNDLGSLFQSINQDAVKPLSPPVMPVSPSSGIGGPAPLPGSLHGVPPVSSASGATASSLPFSDDDDPEKRRLAEMYAEVQAWRREIGKYVDLKALDSLGRHWTVLQQDLESGNRVKIALASKVYVEAEKASIEPLIKVILTSKDARARAVAHSLLKRLSPNSLDRLLEALYATQMTQEKVNVIEALEEYNDPTVTSQVEKFLRHPSRDVRLAVLRTLAAKAKGSLTHILLGALDDQREDVKMDVLQAIGDQRLVGAVPILLKYVKQVTHITSEANENLQAQACLALGMIRDPKALPALKAALQRGGAMYRTKPPNVRAAAALALARFATESTKAQILVELQSLLDETDAIVLNAVKRAIEQINTDAHAEREKAAKPQDPRSSSADIKWRGKLREGPARSDDF